jgi:hypothetical protein
MRRGLLEMVTARVMRTRILDVVAAPATLLLAPLAAKLSRTRANAPICRLILEKFGVSVVQHHYVEPIVFPEDIRHDLNQPRTISGLDLNEAGQLALLEQFRYREELIAIPKQSSDPNEFAYHNITFGPGDAEFLYNMIRHFKPRQIVEIGCGRSTLMAEIAIKKNRQEDSGYRCNHLCIEPYPSPILKGRDLRIVETKVEDCDGSFFESLDENDILFIDSSHVIRPQGDVTHEILNLIGRVRPGVVVHVHDIFTPRDYPAQWVLVDRLMFNEQYLLEAFLCFNNQFEIIGALNWLFHNHLDKMADACPILLQEPQSYPGSFWFRRKC